MAPTRTAYITTAADSHAQIGGIRTYLVKLLLLVVLLSCNLITIASESDLRIDAAIGAVLDIKGQGDTLWLGTAEGLYRWDNVREGKPKQVAVNTGAVSVLQLDDNTLWIGSEQGLFRWDSPGQGLPRPVSVNTGPVGKLYKLNRTLLISAKNGLFVWQPRDEDSPKPINVDVPYVTEFCRGNVNQVWIGSRKGLLLYEEGNGEPVFVPEVNDIPVTSLSDEGSELLIGTEQGLLRWNKTGGSKPDLVLPDVEVHSLSKDGSTLLISTKDSGLFRLDNVHEGRPELIDGRIGGIHKYFKSGTILWLAAGMGTRAGLYRWDRQKEGSPERVTAVSTGYIHNFYRGGGTLWIGAQKGLFQIEGLDTEWDAQLQIISKTPSIIYSDYSLPIRWKIGNYGWRTTREQAYCRVILKNEAGNDVSVEDDEGYGSYEVTLPTLEPGAYTLYVQATDLNGKVSVSQPLRFQVYSSWKDVLLRIVKSTLLVYSLANVIVSIVLILLSRWYQWAFDLFTSPWMQKGSLYFGFALCYLSFVRLWVFERYYRELKKEFDEDRPYLTAQIKRPDGTTVEPDKLLGEFHKHPHILVQGEAGTGKTALLKRLMKIYCESPSVRKAYKLHGFIPIMVSLRDFGDPREVGDDSTIPNLARLALGAKDMLFHDKGLFERLIRRKDFLIILDGLNEADIDKQASRFVAASPKVRFLAASQTTLLSTWIEVYQLSAITPGFAKSLLAAFIGGDRAVEVHTATTEEFWGSIKSGYDVRLIQNAVEEGRPVPTTRLALFDATLESAGEQYPLYVIYEHAWTLWKEKNRRFATNEKLTDSLITPLQEAKVVVARGSKFEFRHDLMRGYLAACWLVREASSIEGMKGRLSEEGVWGLGVSEQDLVFPFLAELIETQDDLRQVAQFATDDPSIRVRLFTACKRVAENRGWAFTISVNEPSPDLLSAT